MRIVLKMCMSFLVCCVTAKGVDCGLDEWVKRDAFRWFRFVMRMNEDIV